ncbi:cation diffusion facilitator family transporter [Stappia stellulata]|uniref:cation diffusion facilitator family transporter n=1 Tax=Stappia stellulata TaxID=71235 RepID=UPI0012EC06AF|nr:cation diffusion facilitator family transporter [Stappia stellulata]
MKISAWLTGVYFVVELAIGLWTGSIAVIADALHTFSAVGGILVALLAARLARRPADAQRSFGWYRSEIIGALVNGGFLLAMAVVVLVMSAMRLFDPIELPTTPMLIAAAGGLATEVVSLALVWTQAREDINVRGALWHIIQTFVGSLLIVVTALVIWLTGFLAIDPLLGMAFGFVLIWASWGILRDASHLLLEGTPPGIDLEHVSAALAELAGVIDVHHPHAWALTSGRHVFSAHMRVRDDAVSETVLDRAHDLLRRRFGFYFSTLQLEVRCRDEETAREIDVTRPSSLPD